MKYIFSILLSFISYSQFAQTGSMANYITSGAVSPLAAYSSEWNDVKYSKCNTAANAAYMTNSEKEIIYILNLIRTYPTLFAKTVLKKYPALSGNTQLADDKYYFQSLMDTLLTMQPKALLLPDNANFQSAKSHAWQSGISNYVGHQRGSAESKAKKYYNGECCDYGRSTPMEIVMSLVIDEGIPNLGHRKICLMDFSTIGVSIQPHKKYGTNAVLDFSF